MTGLDRHLVVGEDGLERAGHELVGGDRAAPARALDHHDAAEGHHHRSPVALRVGVAQRADQRAAGADDRVGDQRRRGGHRGLAAGQDRGPLQSGMAAQRTDVEGAVGVDAVVVEIREVVDVDQQLGRGEAQLHQRHQALPPCQHLGLTSAGAQQADGVLEGSGTLVAEPRRVHGALLLGFREESGCWPGSGPVACRCSAQGPPVPCGSGVWNGDRPGLDLGRVGTWVLVRRPRPLHGLARDLEVVDELRPGPHGGALARSWGSSR